MCKIIYEHKQSVASHGGEGFSLTVEVCADPQHDDAFVEQLGKRALEASVRIRQIKVKL
jgi:hypothetical protein